MRILCLLLVLLPLTAQADSPYPWLADWTGPVPPSQPLDHVFPTPDGFKRVSVPDGSFPAWLRGLPVRADRVSVQAFDGRPLIRPSKGIIVLDVGQRDLQQCADTALRLHAEYLWATGQAKRASYHFTSGDRSRWVDWRRGERFRVAGSKVKRVRGRGRANTHVAFRGWLSHLFRYAGTRSLKFDSDPVGDRPLEAGDFFVQPGGPGHTVMILDIAAATNGQRIALIGQGFMPAEDLHVLDAGGTRNVGGSWFVLPEKGKRLDTPSWPPFQRTDARRFK